MSAVPTDKIGIGEPLDPRLSVIITARACATLGCPARDHTGHDTDDMPEYRDYWGEYTGSPQFRLGFGFTPAVKILMIVFGGSFLGFLILDRLGVLYLQTTEAYLAASADHLIDRFYLWQFLSYPLYHGIELLYFLFSLMNLYFMGPLCEERYGSRKFLNLFFGASLFGALSFAVPAYFWGKHVTLFGAGAPVMGLTVAAAYLHPNVQFVFMFVVPLRLKTIAWILVGIDVFWILVYYHSPVASAGHLGGALFGYVFARYDSAVADWFFRIERRLAAREHRSAVELRQRVDQLLEKIHREGMESLTRGEKKFLKKASEDYRKRIS